MAGSERATATPSSSISTNVLDCGVTWPPPMESDFALPTTPRHSPSFQNSSGNEMQSTDETGKGALRPRHGLITQLLLERQQHGNTKQMLVAEQEKVHDLLRELEHSRQCLDGLINISRLNAQAIRAAVLDVEPRVEEIEREMALLQLPLTSTSHETGLTADHTRRAPTDVGGRHSNTQTFLQSAVSQPKPRDHLDGLQAPLPPRDCTAISGPGATRQDDVAGQGKQSVTASPAEQGFSKADERVGPPRNSKRAVPEFDALDQAFENDFFSESSMRALPSHPPPGQKWLENVLLEASVAKHSPRNPDVVPSAPSSLQMTKRETTRPPITASSKNNPQHLWPGPVGSGATEATTPGAGPLASHNDPAQLDSKQWNNPAQLASQPILQLPPSFLAKAENYSVSIATSDTTLSRASSPPTPSPREVPTVDSHTKPVPGRNTGIPADHTHQQSTGAVGLSLGDVRPSSVPEDNYNVIPVKMTNRLDCINWTMSEKYNPIFTSASEKSKAQNSEAGIRTQNSPFWIHHIRYEPSIVEVNKYRTVHIDHIPEHCDVSDVLREIRFGSIESINLCNIGNLKGPKGPLPDAHKFARVVFLQEKKASDFQRWAYNKPLMIGGRQVRVYVEMEPTYPRHPEVEEALESFGMRRIIGVLGLTDTERSMLPAFIQRVGRFELVSLRLKPHDGSDGGDNVYQSKTTLEFRSILHAYRVFRAIDAGALKTAKGILIESDYCRRRPEGH